MKIKFCLAALIIVCLFSCNFQSPQQDDREQFRVEKISRLRCSFDLPKSLMLGKISEEFDKEGYFKIESQNSGCVMQLFVFNSHIDVESKLAAQREALDSPEVFISDTIVEITRFGNYVGKGVLMKGTYNGGVVKGAIKLFCTSTGNKGFLVIRQMTGETDKKNFDLVENSFHLK